MPGPLGDGEKWVPEPQDLEWTKTHLGRINDGGIWMTTFAIYKVHHSTHLLEMVAGFPYGPGHERIVECLKRIGWMMLEPHPPSFVDPPFAHDGHVGEQPHKNGNVGESPS